MHWEIRGLEKLSFRERQAVMLKESGRTTEEISNALKVSVSSVSTLLSRAKNKGYEIVGIISDHELGLSDLVVEDGQEYE